MRKCTLLLALLLPLFGASQGLEAGLYGGVTLYEGDLAPNEIPDYFKTLHGAFGGFVRLNAGQRFSARLGLLRSTLSGYDSLRNNAQRNLSFETKLLEFTALAEWNVLRWKPGNGATTIVPYFFGGAAIYHFDPRTFYQNQWIDLQPLGTEGQGLPGYGDKYELTQLAVPFGGGLKFIFNDKLVIGLEIGARKLFTDYLDDVGSTRVVYQEIRDGNGPLAARLSNPSIDPDEADTLMSYQRGKPAKDWYYAGLLSVSYILGDGERSGKAAERESVTSFEQLAVDSWQLAVDSWQLAVGS